MGRVGSEVCGWMTTPVQWCMHHVLRCCLSGHEPLAHWCVDYVRETGGGDGPRVAATLHQHSRSESAPAQSGRGSALVGRLGGGMESRGGERHCISLTCHGGASAGCSIGCFLSGENASGLNSMPEAFAPPHSLRAKIGPAGINKHSHFTPSTRPAARMCNR